jgi:hypothetical protein
MRRQPGTALTANHVDRLRSAAPNRNPHASDCMFDQSWRALEPGVPIWTNVRPY